MIITIDGPSASGKSTIAHLLAEQLGFMHLNSGLIFRGIAYLLVRQNNHQKPLDEFVSSLSDADLQKIVTDNKLRYEYTKEGHAALVINDGEITRLLKTPEMDEASSIISMNSHVRLFILGFVQQMAQNNNMVADGRDCGTIMFPQANFKFFLTASPDVRAQRWCNALKAKKESVHLSFTECKKIVMERDERDTTRVLAPLKPADDALIIDSSHLSIQQVLAEIIDVIGVI